jgi:hypothetical protein
MVTDHTEAVLDRTWRPTLSVIGADGLPAIADAGNVLRPQTSLKLSLRLPPTVDGVKATTDLKRLLEADPPQRATVTFKSDQGATGWNAPPTAPWLARILEDASKAFYGKSAAAMGEGGTIPFMAMLGKHFPDAQFLITGVLGPHSNAHGPNEFLHVPYAKNSRHASPRCWRRMQRVSAKAASTDAAGNGITSCFRRASVRISSRAMSASNIGRGGASIRRPSSPSSRAVPSQHQLLMTWTSTRLPKTAGSRIAAGPRNGHCGIAHAESAARSRSWCCAAASTQHRHPRSARVDGRSTVQSDVRVAARSSKGDAWQRHRAGFPALAVAKKTDRTDQRDIWVRLRSRDISRRSAIVRQFEYAGLRLAPQCVVMGRQQRFYERRFTHSAPISPAVSSNSMRRISLDSRASVADR